LSDRDGGYLWDIVKTARQLQQWALESDPSDFEEGRVARLAVERLLEILGIATMRLSQEFREAHPEIEWREIVAMRNVIAHQYDDIIFERLWDAMTVDVPELIRLLEPLLPPPPE
jgi:uncharacterized protein with HEPN domain